MGKPYSEDLREAGSCGGFDRRVRRNAAAKQFGVAISTAVGWGTTAAPDRQRGARQDGRPQAEGDFRRTPSLGC